VTWIASPYSPSSRLRRKLRSLSELTEEGHHYGLILYALSYTILAYLFPHKPYIIATGILPLAYGDSIAALVGDRYGKTDLIGEKTLEGTVAMFVTSLIALIFSFAYFSIYYQITLQTKIFDVITISLIIALIELFTPKGFDNISVPLVGALAFVLMDGI
jgi:dolichol kinase